MDAFKFGRWRALAVRHATIFFLLVLTSNLPLPSSAQFQPRLVILNRVSGSNDLNLQCRMPTSLTNDDGQPIRSAKFYVNTMSQDLETLLTDAKIPFSSDAEDETVSFTLRQGLEGNYLCGPPAGNVSLSMPFRILCTYSILIEKKPTCIIERLRKRIILPK